LLRRERPLISRHARERGQTSYTMNDEDWALFDIEDIILQRIEQIEEDDPDLEVDYHLIGEENRGVIVTQMEDLLVSVEFVESDLSWRRELAVDEYLSALNEQVLVAVIVPTDAYLHVYDRLRRLDRQGLILLSYESLGILSTPMAG